MSSREQYYADKNSEFISKLKACFRSIGDGEYLWDEIHVYDIIKDFINEKE